MSSLKLPKRQARQGQPPIIDIYARLSHAANGETIQVDDQADLGEEAIERRSAVLGKVFKDNSKSAWNPNTIRPEWELLMTRLESGESDGVWVYDLTRFSRKILEGERLVELAAQGIRVWSQSGEYDLTTADGRAHFREAMVAAARESDKISERTRRGHLRRAKRGRSHGGIRGYALPGWAPAAADWEPGDPREYVSDEQVRFERAIVRECYDRLFSNEPLASLVSDLNARGIKTSMGGTWSRITLRQMLSRATVAGLMEHRNVIMGELHKADPIVTQEELHRLRGIFESRRRGRPPMVGVYLLTGLIECTECHRTLNGQVRSNMRPYDDGSQAREYRCKKSVDVPGCGRNFIDARTAERVVAVAVKERLGDPRHAERMAQRLEQLQGDRSLIEAEISSLQESADGLAEKTAAWGLDRVDRAMAPIMARIAELTQSLATMDAPESAEAASLDAIRAWDEAESRGDAVTLRAMIKRAFPRLAIIPPRQYGDHRPDRFCWDTAASR